MPPPPRRAVATPRALDAFIARYGTALLLLVALIVASQSSPAFLRPYNLANILQQVAITGVLSLGMTLVMLTGGIDLSVGAVVALVSVLIAGTPGAGVGAAVSIATAVGGLVGCLNGVGVVYGRLQPFIMTLGMMSVVRGLAFLYSKGQPIPMRTGELDGLGAGTVGGVPISGIVFVGLLVATGTFLSRWPAGRHIYAIGSNAEAAELAGVNVRRHLIGVYAFSGAMAGVGGVLFVAQQGVGMALAGVGYELNAIAAVVLGGTSLFGGEGTVYGTAVGAVTMGVLGNVMNLSGVNPFAQDLLKGVILVAAVLGQRVVTRRLTGAR